MTNARHKHTFKYPGGYSGQQNSLCGISSTRMTCICTYIVSVVEENDYNLLHAVCRNERAQHSNRFSIPSQEYGRLFTNNRWDVCIEVNKVSRQRFAFCLRIHDCHTIDTLYYVDSI